MIAVRWAVFAVLQALWMVLAPAVVAVAIARWAARPPLRRIEWTAS